jgi:hypothetical protein
MDIKTCTLQFINSGFLLQFTEDYNYTALLLTKTVLKFQNILLMLF